jgi:D-alanyl-D-alanine carboxypeptidase (penicillin-binding protein 5/6)
VNTNKNPSTVIGGGLSEGGNSLGKTVPRRSSYISRTAANVANISDDRAVDNVILIDLSTYESIAEKAADTKIYPASMTKVMSLLVACENLKSLTTKLTVSKKYIDYAYQTGGSLFGVQQGDELDTQDLLYLTSYWSDTVAVMMLAEHIAGTEEEFVKLMNAKAHELGLKNTRFDNCTGLFSEDNYTTCREMAAIMAYALEHPLCRELLTSTKPYKIMIDEKPAYTLWSPSWYRERLSNKPTLNTVTVSGGKTGYIPESGHCLVSYAVGTSSGKRYIQVVVVDNKAGEDIKYVYNNFAN